MTQDALIRHASLRFPGFVTRARCPRHQERIASSRTDILMDAQNEVTETNEESLSPALSQGERGEDRGATCGRRGLSQMLNVATTLDDNSPQPSSPSTGVVVRSMAVSTLSIKPYSSISSSLSHLLRSQSRSMRSKGWPVVSAYTL